jgi:hypothetical protein
LFVLAHASATRPAAVTVAQQLTRPTSLYSVPEKVEEEVAGMAITYKGYQQTYRKIGCMSFEKCNLTSWCT